MESALIALVWVVIIAVIIAGLVALLPVVLILGIAWRDEVEQRKIRKMREQHRP